MLGLGMATLIGSVVNDALEDYLHQKYAIGQYVLGSFFI